MERVDIQAIFQAARRVFLRGEVNLLSTITTAYSAISDYVDEINSNIGTYQDIQNKLRDYIAYLESYITLAESQVEGYEAPIYVFSEPGQPTESPLIEELCNECVSSDPSYTARAKLENYIDEIRTLKRQAESDRDGWATLIDTLNNDLNNAATYLTTLSWYIELLDGN